MNIGSPQITRRVIILVLLGIVLVVSIGIYTAAGDSFTTSSSIGAATSKQSLPLQNPGTLQDWLPAGTYAYTLARVRDYLNTNSLSVTSMAVKGAVTFDPDTYDFDLLIQPQARVLGITVQVYNFNSNLSTAVLINGTLQAPQTLTSSGKSSTPVTTTYVGFDTLINRGASTVQVQELQKIFHTFAPSAKTVAIDTSTITAPLDPNNPTVAYSFSMTVDGKAYNATFNCTGLTEAQLLLSDPTTGNQVFDSGTIDDQS